MLYDPAVCLFTPSFTATRRSIGVAMSFSASVLIGFFLGFAFGVGCALAVMYSIYNGGYRAAVRDSQMREPPERFRAALTRLAADATPNA